MLTLWLFFPGFMSWDSAYQWWQVRHGAFDPAHPQRVRVVTADEEQILDLVRRKRDK